MQFLVLFTALLSSTALAQLPSTVNRVCATRYSGRPTSTIRTTTFRATTTRAAARVITVTPRVTRTLAGVTGTTTRTRVFTTVTTLPGSTDVFTTSQTYTFTQTTTALAATTIATVQTRTITDFENPTVVPTPNGFTAFVDGPGYVQKRNAVLEKREAIEARAGAVKGVLPVIGAAPLMARQAINGRQYPVGIQCTSRTTFFATRTVTRTAQTTATTTVPARTATRTITVSVTSTATVQNAGATSIVSVSTFELATSTSTTTTTQVSTATVTILQPTATTYAQCDPETNVIGSVQGGQQIGTLTFNPLFNLQSFVPGNTDGVACCVACAQATNCAGFAQTPGGACYYVITDGQCNPAASFGDTYNYIVSDTPGYIVGNAQCGLLEPQAGLPA